MKQILNALGEPVVLDERETKLAGFVGSQIKNAGYEIDTTALTQISKSIVDQKFYQVPFADYMPVTVGEGAWARNITTYRSFNLGDDFSTGIIGAGSQGARQSTSGTQIDAINVAQIPWAKSIQWSLFDLQEASRSGNWDLVTSLEKSRKKNWDLGLQKLSFLGLGDDLNVRGLLTQSDVNINTALLGANFISGMTAAELNTFCAGVYEAYRANCNRTVEPTHFVLPEQDYNGLASFSSSDFPIKSKLQVLQETFSSLTGNQNFKILKSAYGNRAIYKTAAGGADVHRYAIYNYDEDSGRLNIGVNYTATLANSIDNFQFYNTAYGMFTGFKAFRPNEFLYLTSTHAA